MYEFGRFRLDALKRILTRDDQPVQLTSKAFDTLQLLVENRDRILEKREMIKALWPNTFVEEINLTVHISSLRKALGERPSEHAYIVTVPGRGYRFVATVKEVKAEEAAARNGAGEPAIAFKSIAVLPFKYIGADDGNEYLSVGLASALITRLSNIKRLLVRPMSTVLKHANSNGHYLDASRELGIEVLLGGDIQKVGSRVRIHAHLLRVTDEVILWADTFEDEATNIFAVQDSISAQVQAALAMKPNEDENSSLVKDQAINPEAYRLYIKGRYFWEKRQKTHIDKAIECFKQAIEIEPGYGSAYVGLADSYVMLGEYLYLSPREAFPLAKTAALRVLEIDESIAEAHATLAEILWFYDWNTEEAENEYRRALRLKPAYAIARHWYAWFLMVNERFEEAHAEIDLALDLDPYSLSVHTSRGMVFYYSGHCQKAVESHREALDMDPSFVHGRYYLGMALADCGEIEAAIREFEGLRAAEPIAQTLAMLGYVYGLSGNDMQALKIIDALKEISKRRYVSAYNIATVYAGMNRRNDVFKFLERAIQERSAWMVFLKTDPVFKRVRDDRRFVNIIGRMSPHGI